MMRKLFAFAVSALFLVSCGGNSGTGGKEEQPVDVTGEWELTSVSTKSAKVGDETVTVYIKFSSGAFDMYQILGEGLPRKYSGSYTIAGNVLGGKYSDGTSWGSTYEVALSGSSLTMTKVGKSETDTYKKTTIPKEIIERAI